jgi:two-component system, OmpR family, alkaline phosphatase synthesis response regulator PhoP
MKILLIEDNTNLAFGLSRSLEAEGFEVEVEGDGAVGLERAIAIKPDLIVLDLMLPGMDGYTVLERLRSAGNRVPVLILTARGEETDKISGFRLGADDYVTKPFSLSELIARVQAILRRARGSEQPAESMIPEQFGSITIDPSSRLVTRGGTQVALTPKEFDLLLTLARRNGAVASRLQLLKEVWGHQAEVMTRTVDIHIAELRRKLEDDPSDPRHILTVWKAGYRLER